MDNNKDITKVYITKYALTSGIFSMEGEIRGDTVRGLGDHNGHIYLDRDWWLTKAAAITRAEELKEKKIKSLKKQLKKLEAMTF